VLSSTAARTAAAAVPPAESTDIAANCADPANVVAENTTTDSASKPASDARTPKVRPKAATAGVSGRIARAPAPVVRASSIVAIGPSSRAEPVARFG
jgi:hypothetical protein